MFDPTCKTDQYSGVLGYYNQTKLAQVMSLAKSLNLWIIVDYHGYTDVQSPSKSCWLTFWRSLVYNFTSSYSQIIWEPENEPHTTTIGDVAGLSSAYQAVIDEIRSLGDTHWIVVQNLCSGGNCGFSDANDWKGY